MKRVIHAAALLTILSPAALNSRAESAPYPDMRAKLAHLRPNSTMLMSGVKQRLRFTSHDTIVSLLHYDLPVAAADPDGKTVDLRKILLDPKYIDPSHSPDADDFTLLIRGVRASGAHVTLSSMALCKWQQGKSGARCRIEGDGGSFKFVPDCRGPTLRSSAFSMRVDGKGFRIGSGDTDATGDVTVINNASGGQTDIPLKFR